MLGKQYKKLLSTLSSSDKALLKNVEGLSPETIEDGYVDVAIEVNPEIFLDLGLSDIGTKDDKDYIENDLGIFYAGENSDGKCWFWAFTQIDEDKAKTGDFSEEDIAGFGDGESGVIPENKETEQFKRFKEIIKPFVIQSIKDEYYTNVERGVQENMNTDKKKSSNSLKENKKSKKVQVTESTKQPLKEEVQDEAYEIADYILDAIKDKDTITRDEFEEQFALACRKLYGIDNVWEVVDYDSDKVTINGKEFDVDDLLEGDIRGILSYNGWATNFSNGDLTTKDIEEGCKGKESCKKESCDNKSIKETWDGENVIDNLVDRAKSYMDEGSDIDDAINGAIDTGLIYTKDIRDLAIHYDTLPSDSELIEGFIEQLWDDMYHELGDYEPEGAESEDDDLEEESLKENKKKEPVKQSIKESLPTRKSNKKKPVKESVEDNSEVNKIAKFLKGCLEQGYDFEGTSWIDLDGDFSVSVGWLPGYDPEDANRDGSIVDENGYGLCYEITECPNTYAYVDFESLLMPYNDETGDVYSVGSNFKKDDNCEEIAKYLLDEYEYIKQEFDNGELTID